jgi:hypothetical protein
MQTISIFIRRLTRYTVLALLAVCVASADISQISLGREKYEHTELLRQVKGVGPLTSSAYVLTRENPGRFAKSREPT